MYQSMLDEPRFREPLAARRYLESIRWPNGPACPHCAAITRITRVRTPGLYSCGGCHNRFTVTVDTLFESTKIPLHKWTLAVAMFATSGGTVSTRELQRHLGVAYATAWSMCQRLRGVMKSLAEGHPQSISGIDETLRCMLRMRLPLASDKSKRQESKPRYFVDKVLLRWGASRST
jgi:transposase-like protein